MSLSADLRVLAARTALRIRTCDMQINQKKDEIRNIEAGIARQGQIIAAARHHLLSFFIQGNTTLSMILESKSSAASVKRKIALSELQQADLMKQKEDALRSIEDLQARRKTLMRKADRVSENLVWVLRVERLRVLNRTDNETEEQCNWGM